MKPKTIYTILLVLAIIGGVWLVQGTDFSIIGQDQVSVDCRFTDDCNFNLTLPNYRVVDSYTLDLTFTSVPGEVEGLTTLTPVSNRGSFTDEWKDSSGTIRSQSLLWFYFYRLPSSWDLENIYSVYVESEISGSARRTTDSSRFWAYNDIGFLTINHPSDTVQTCGDVSWRDAPMCIIMNYRDRQWRNEWITNWNHISLFRNNYEPRNWVITREAPELNVNHDFVVIYESHILINEFMDKYNITSDNLLMVNLLEKQERPPRDVSSSFSLPPTVKVGYTQSVLPSNVQIFVGDDLVQTISSTNNENYTTVDLASSINNYCDRTTTVDECVVPITLRSLTDGRVKVHSETGTLRALSFQPQDDFKVGEELNKPYRHIDLKEYLHFIGIGVLVIIFLFVLWFRFIRK